MRESIAQNTELAVNISVNRFLRRSRVKDALRGAAVGLVGSALVFCTLHIQANARSNSPAQPYLPMPELKFTP